MNDLPRRAITRTAKLATLPVGLAGRTALGLGKRLGGGGVRVVEPARGGAEQVQGSQHLAAQAQGQGVHGAEAGADLPAHQSAIIGYYCDGEALRLEATLSQANSRLESCSLIYKRDGVTRASQHARIILKKSQPRLSALVARFWSVGVG